MMIFLNIADRLEFVMEIVNVYCAVGARFLNIWYRNFVLIDRLSSSTLLPHDRDSRSGRMVPKFTKQSHIKPRCRLCIFSL